MATRPITELDFSGIKQQLKSYLASQDKFKDYDFDGSNLSILLDVLAYNTYQNNFMTNMAFAEAFLDSALKEESVMSHAKSLNYLPRSAKSAVAVVDVIIVSPANEASFVIPPGTRFVTNSKGNNFSFYTDRGHIALRELGTNRYISSCINIFEGSLVEERFKMGSNFNGFLIANETVDTSSIHVKNLTTNEEYLYRNDIFGTDKKSNVFYLEPEKGSYRIVFGDGDFGKVPQFGEEVSVVYRITSGEAANGSNRFSTTAYSNATINVLSKAIGGAEKESIESIKFFAPRSIQVQERAVTRKDYEILLKQRFPEILDVSAYDGSELIPPRHGKVAISVNVSGGISNAMRNSFLTYLSDKTPLSIQPVFIDADFMHIALEITVRVNAKENSKNDGEIKQMIIDSVMKFNKETLEKFGSVFYDSHLVTRLNELDRSFLSSALIALPYVTYSPDRLIRYSPTFNFNSKLIKPYPYSINIGLEGYVPAIRGYTFVYKGVRSFFQDDGYGNLQVFSSDTSNQIIVGSNVGKVNYDTGEVRLSDFAVDSYEGAAIKIVANFMTEDIIAPKNRVLSIKDNDIMVNILKV